MRSRRAFLSHSWRNKSLARRIARRLAHRGVVVWIDEEEMQIGDRLPERGQRNQTIQPFFLYSLRLRRLLSKWVAQEIEAAKTTAGIAIIPLIAEEGLISSLLDESLGIQITSALTLEDQLDILADAILPGRSSDFSDPTLLHQDLTKIAMKRRNSDL